MRGLAGHQSLRRDNRLASAQLHRICRHHAFPDASSAADAGGAAWRRLGYGQAAFRFQRNRLLHRARARGGRAICPEEGKGGCESPSHAANEPRPRADRRIRRLAEGPPRGRGGPS